MKSDFPTQVLSFIQSSRQTTLWYFRKLKKKNFAVVTQFLVLIHLGNLNLMGLYNIYNSNHEVSPHTQSYAFAKSQYPHLMNCSKRTFIPVETSHNVMNNHCLPKVLFLKFIKLIELTLTFLARFTIPIVYEITACYLSKTLRVISIIHLEI